MKRSVPLVVLALAVLPLPAAAAVADYLQCVALVRTNPAQAEESARAWQNEGGGAAAIHCSALALTALGRYAEAARELDALARDKAIADNLDRAALFDQAGNAWLLAGMADNAVQSFSAAVGESPNDIDMLADRARARAMQKNWAGADADLSVALLKDQNRVDLLVLRASARWALGRKPDAATDILRALELYPDYPAALVERGVMRYSAGDTEGARKDWTKAASGQGDASAAARRNLAALDAESKAGR
jgi:regulator of sirC expression with transglutaminase-like and TPR domain